MDDWLDARLQEDQYLPDDGFTARVTARLSAPSLMSERRRALLFTPFFVLAIAIFWLESLTVLFSGKAGIFNFGSQLRPVLRQSASYLDAFSLLGNFLEQPAVLFGCLGAMALTAYLGSPALRRWV